MDGSAAAGTDARGWTVRFRIAIALWLLFGLVVWNDVFDAAVLQGGLDYLTAQALHQQGAGPAATIPGVMRPAIATGAGQATACGASVAAIGLLGVWIASRRREADLALSARRE